MINTKIQLREYLLKDKEAIGRQKRIPVITDYIWRFMISLRHCEYHCNLWHIWADHQKRKEPLINCTDLCKSEKSWGGYQ